MVHPVDTTRMIRMFSLKFAVLDVGAYVEMKLYEICKHIACVLALAVLPMVCLAEMLNTYLESKHGVKVLRINCLVHREHFGTDHIHVNHLGYAFYMDRCIGLLLYPYYKQIQKRKVGRTSSLQ